MVYTNYGTCNYSTTKKTPKDIHPQTHTYEGNNFKTNKVKKTSLLLFVYFIMYIAYLFTGAAVFSIIERPAEKAARAQFQEVIQRFMSQNPTVSGEAVQNLVNEITNANNKGVYTINSSVVQNWSFEQSLFFTSTVLTTIGYGHVTPLTRSGKIFCMLYAMVGIPLTLVLLSALVERLLTPTTSLLKWLNFKFGKSLRPLSIRVLHLIIIVVIFLGIFLFIPAIMFEFMEPDWDYLDSLYYCFISLTTIGLGDFVPGNSPTQPYTLIYKVATTGYLFIGITFMMLTLAVFYDIPQLNLGMLFTMKDNLEEKWMKINSKQMSNDCERANIIFPFSLNKRRFSTN